jgi:peptidoglycan hydrolase CwlO-like protein
MKFKDSSISIKKVIVVAIISIFVGSGLGIMGSISEDEFSKIDEKNEVVLAKISEQEKVLEESSVYLNTLSTKETELKDKKEEILKAEREAKAEEERLAKEEAERIAKAEAEAKAEEERIAKAEAERVSKQESERIASANAVSPGSGSNSNSLANQEPVGIMVWKTATGKKYHSTNNCGNTNSKNTTYITIEAAESQGLTPCSKCY